MASDAATFFWSFLAVFGALGWYLWHLERKVDRLRDRVETVQASMAGASGATNLKPDEAEPEDAG